MSYGDTLNLPRTDFPMRANLPEREPPMLKAWEEMRIYEKVRASRQGASKFILHDGPPYANGDIHMGTALNKVLKDIVNKYKTLRGFDTPYVPGWDTHGLPIEHAAIKILGIDRSKVDPLTLRQQCRDYALKYRDIQREEFRRLGVRGDWENPYMTLKPEFEATEIRIFGEMARRGFIYRGKKAVYWCPSCETALAEAEIEYSDVRSPSIYVRFPVRDGRGKLPEQDTYVLIWTTTPWTMPGNTGIALNPEFAYQLVKTEKGNLLMAAELAPTVLRDLSLTAQAVVGQWKGSDLQGVVCRHPLHALAPIFDRDSLVVLGDYVTAEDGTGCVHTAPGHGQEDFATGVQYGLPIITPIDDKGRFTDEAGPFAGIFYEDGNKVIAKALDESGNLLKLAFIQHQYAHCWRCKSPVIFRATTQWFASVEGFRQAALEAIEKVQWIPTWGEERIANMVRDRADWCISRQRVWGVPIPVFYCLDCGEPVITPESIEAVAGLFGKEGSDAWWRKEAAEILPSGFKCPHCGHTEFRKEKDIMDVWFDSGSTHAAVLRSRPELTWPSDLYLEGSDQHRGWFQSSLLTGVAALGGSPYKACLTHGFVVDGEGRKMSKSLGNVIFPEKVIKQYGADILRLWVSSSDYKADIRLSDDILKQLAEIYRKIRNTARYLLGNLYDFDPGTDSVPVSQMEELDRWALGRLAGLIERCGQAYDNYDFHLVYHDVHTFCVTDMSNFYLDVLKDRLYTSPAKSARRRAAQTVLYEVLQALVRVISPVLTFTSEEIWGMVPGRRGAEAAPDGVNGTADTVQTALWPEADPEWRNEELEGRWAKLLDVRGEVLKALELARGDKKIGTSLEADVYLVVPEELKGLVTQYAEALPEIFIVSHVHLADSLPADLLQSLRSETISGLAVGVTRASGVKCERCWTYSETVGHSAQHPTLCRKCAEALAAGE